MPLPRDGYVWRWARTDATGWNEDGAPPPNGTWIKVPPAFKSQDSDSIVVDAGSVRAKTQAELDAEVVVAKRRAAREEAVDSELKLLGLKALRSRLAASGKQTAKIQLRINKHDARITAALADLP